MHVVWHPSKWWDRCMSGDEKKRDSKIVDVTDNRF